MRIKSYSLRSVRTRPSRAAWMPFDAPLPAIISPAGTTHCTCPVHPTSKASTVQSTESRSAMTARPLKILTVFGTRPEAIKFAPVWARMRGAGAAIDSVLCSTGQQRDLLQQTLADLSVVSDIDLDLMQPRQDPLTFCARAMIALAPVMENVRPDVVLVQGDTTSALAGALACAHRQAALGHVEAGLRTFDDRHPFPEEINRRLIDQLAAMAFAPTPAAARNLARDGIAAERILVTGNTAIDTLVQTLRTMPAAVPTGRRLILVTCHRRESFGAGVRAICDALKAIVERNPDVDLVFVTHPNPEAGGVARERLAGVRGIDLRPPLDYTELVGLMRSAWLVLTDSGGLQEEAPLLGKPVLVLRQVTERPEGVDAGVARLVGTNGALIIEAVQRLLNDPVEYARMSRPLALYGDGEAAGRIVTAMLHQAGRQVAAPAPFVPVPIDPQL